MKKKILAGVMFVTMIFSLSACGSSEGTASNSQQKVATTNSVEKSKKTLTDAGFVLDSYNGLSYYAPPKESYAWKSEDPESNKQDRKSVTKYYEINGTGDKDWMFYVSYRTNNDSKITSDSIETIISTRFDGDYDLSKLKETDSMYIYQEEAKFVKTEESNSRCNAYIFVKDSTDYYRIVAEHIDGYENDSINVKYEKCWTEDTWSALLDTLTYIK